MANPTDSFGNVAGVLSAAAAWVALVLAFMSNRTSKQALRLSQTEVQRRVPRIVAYLIDAVGLPANAGGRTIQVSLSLTNPSDTANTVARAELAISHLLATKTLAQVLIPASATDGMGVPRRLDAHATVTGHFRFAVPAGLVSTSAIRQQVVQLTDAQDVLVAIPLGVIREEPGRHQ